jgi:predicted membrane-bound spermidine synthase
MGRKDWLWHPALVVFISNACVMTLELVAGRIIAPYVGVSLYTWTSVIGVILAGMSAGNFAGGKLADRYASRRMLGALFLLAGLGSLSVLLTANVFGEQGMALLPGVPLVARMVLYIGLIFFIPSAVLGTISPLVIKLTLQDLSRTGNTVGRIYAASSLGSILGTFATGYFLISWFGTRAILLGVGVALLIMGLLLGQWAHTLRVPAAASAVLLVAVFTLPLRPILLGPCLKETNYFCIRVHDQTLSPGVTVRVLTLDRLVHSFSSLTNPRLLTYVYEKVSSEVTDYLALRDGTLHAFFIGGGGYTFPRYMEAVYPSSTIDVAEIDPDVTQTAYALLGLSHGTRIKTTNEDARLYLQTAPSDVRYNVIFGDAFNDFTVPYHLTTREFDQLVRAHLTDNGIYVVNLIDGKPLPFAIPFLRTLQTVFGNVYLVPTNADWENLSRNTYVLLASPKPIDVAALRTFKGSDDTRNIHEWILPDARVQALLKNDPPFILTDDYVPVDNLLAPMFASDY